MKLLEGKILAEEILARVKEGVSDLDRMPGFGAILVGEDPASRMYVDLKKKAAQKCGMLFSDYTLPSNATNEQVLEIVEFLNADADIDGILIQLPLPGHLDRDRIINAIEPKKDVDGLTQENQKCFREGRACFVCPFPRAITVLLEASEMNLAGKKGVVLANSEGFGSGMVSLMTEQKMHATFVLAEEKDSRIQEFLDADVIVSAVGKAGSVTAEMVRDGAIVIDGGIEKVGDIVAGDVAVSEFADRDVTITPVPGGVGPLTVACLIENVYFSSLRRKINF